MVRQSLTQPSIAMRIVWISSLHSYGFAASVRLDAVKGLKYQVFEPEEISIDLNDHRL